MAEPFLSEIRIFSFNYPPQGWAFCNGQTLPISQNQALFSLMGTYYGGNGQTTFKLPDLQGQVAIHQGNNFNIGQTAGEEAHTLLTSELPAHVHTLQAANVVATSGDVTGKSLAQPNTIFGNFYAPASTATTLAPNAVSSTGGSQSHNNIQPYLVLNFCIALTGIFPSRN